MQSKEPDKKSPEKVKKEVNGFLRYTDVAARMLIIILLGVLGGVQLDKWTGLETPVFTLVLSLAATGGSMYLIIREVTKK